jgi:hypothetical protein
MEKLEILEMLAAIFNDTRWDDRFKMDPEEVKRRILKLIEKEREKELEVVDPLDEEVRMLGQ